VPSFIREKADNCFMNSMTYAYSFDGRVDDALLQKLAEFGTLDVKRNFRRPFFFLRVPDGTVARGTLGDDRIRASFPNATCEDNRAAFEERLDAILSGANSDNA
jgi:hypothetical protein